MGAEIMNRINHARFVHVKPHSLFVAILALTAVLRLWHLGQADVVTDEAFLAFRALGWIDFLNSPVQGTPVEWFEKLPWWTSFSFHDHPPLVFALQHLALRIGGVNVAALRLPSALAGIAMVALFYALGLRVSARRTVAVTIAAFASVSVLMVWPGRLGLQESVLLLLATAAVYCFSRTFEDSRWWYVYGTVVGLGMLAKYTFVVVPLACVVYLLWCQRVMLRQWVVYRAGVVTAVVFSPVLIYNVMLFRTRGHFDLQIASWLGQQVPEWSYLLGKDIGSVGERFVGIWRNLFLLEWAPVVAAGIAASVWLVVRVWRRRDIIQVQRHNSFLLPEFTVIGIVLTLGMLLVIGPGYRFLVLLWWWMILALGAAADECGAQPRMRNLTLSTAAVLIAGTCAYAVVNLVRVPQASRIALFPPSLIQPELHAYGGNQLERVLTQELAGTKPAIVLNMKFLPLKRMQLAAIEAHYQGVPDERSVARAIVHDESISFPMATWYLTRRMIYEGWPVVSSDGSRGIEDVLRARGIREMLFVAAGPGAVRDQGQLQSVHTQTFGRELIAKGAVPIADIDPYFRVYRLSW